MKIRLKVALLVILTLKWFTLCIFRRSAARCLTWKVNARAFRSNFITYSSQTTNKVTGTYNQVEKIRCSLLIKVVEFTYPPARFRLIVETVNNNRVAGHESLCNFGEFEKTEDKHRVQQQHTTDDNHRYCGATASGHSSVNQRRYLPLNRSRAGFEPHVPDETRWNDHRSHDHNQRTIMRPESFYNGLYARFNIN
ncbi:hypothetical protein TcasGA2_TC011366 [Tribolium castaneum]|uniref:Uncharacterized protein n=1 Tax=Tribolium castaneum TaxID=7070 RepID=D6X488_TRICA|nr:hypothetical protein TcasGA2_TC011366 [Tribolium castaneum]